MNGPVTLADFRARFPEFVSADDGLIQGFLDSAFRRLVTPPAQTSAVWGDLLSEGHLYLAASLLARAPNGQMARLDPDKPLGESTYSVDYKDLERRVTCLVRVF